MIDWLFGFRGEIGRARYVAGLSLLLFSALVLVVGVGVAAIGLHWPRTIWSALTAFVILILGAWSILALSLRRLRDLGAPAGWVISGLLLLAIAESIWSPLALPGPWSEASKRPITTLLVMLLGLALTLWPGRTTRRAAEERPGGFAPNALFPIAACALALVGLGLVFDPLQSPTCPAYGAGAPSDDCASQGLLGRFYSSAMVVQANRRLDRQDPHGALKMADQALKVRPGFVYAFNSRGLAYDQLKDGEHALAAYDQALALQPAYVNGLINRSTLLYALGRQDRALADLRTILSVQPDNAYAKRGVAHLTSGRR